MSTGESTAVLNGYLNVHRNVAFAGIAAEYVHLHTDQPGAAGTANHSALTTGNQITFNAPSGGAMTLNSLGSFTMTATETITHVSRQSAAATGGTFYGSHDLTAPVPVISGSVVSFTTFTMSCGPAAT